MPVAGIENHIERVKAERIGVVSDLAGNCFPEPSNYYTDWWWGKKDEWGDPVDWVIGVPGGWDGLNFFVSVVGKGAATQACQNTDPIANDISAFVTSQPWTPGHSPATQQMATKSGLPRPESGPIVTSIPIAKGGFAAGTYPIAYRYIDKRGKTSGWSDAVFVNIPQGGRVLVSLPQDTEDGVKTFVLGMGTKGGNVSTLREQRRWRRKSVPTNYELSGPLKNGNRSPAPDPGAKPTPPLTKLVNSPRPLQKGTYKIRQARVTDFGESEASDAATWVISEDIPNTALRISHEPDPDDQGINGIRFYVELDGVEYKVYDGIEGSVANASGGVRQSFDINGGNANIQGVANTGNRRPSGGSGTGSTGGSTGSSGSTGSTSARQTTSGSSSSSQSLESNTGNVQNQTSYISGGGSGTESTKKDRARARMERRKARREERRAAKNTTSTSTGATKQEETVPEPSGALETPQVLASLAPLAPGVYICSFSRASVYGESMASPTASFTIGNNGSGGATNVVEIRAPHPFNEIVNGDFMSIDSDGHPIGHTQISNGGGLVSTVDGALVMDTVVAQTTNSPTHGSNVIQVNRDANYWVRADLEVSWAAGTFETILEEYSTSTPTLGTTAPIRNTFLKSVSETGNTRYELKFGPGGGAVAWHADTVSARVYHRMTGASRNMRIVLKNWYFRSFGGGTRKFTTEGGRYNVNPPPETSYPFTSYKIIGPPPGARTAPADVVDAPTALQKHDFAGGSSPSGWSVLRNTANTVASVETGAKINGTYGIRYQKTNTSSGLIMHWKSFAASRKELASRQLIVFDQLPTRGVVYFMALYEGNDNSWMSTTDAAYNRHDLITAVGISSTGEIHYLSQDPDDRNWWWTDNANVFARVGDVIDVQLAVQRAHSGSHNGIAQVSVGINGAVRQEWYKDTGLRTSFDHVGVVAHGAPYMSDSAATFNYRSDDWIISPWGAPSYIEPAPIPGEPIPEADRPRVTTATVMSQNFDGDVALLTPNIFGNGDGGGSATIGTSPSGNISPGGPTLLMLRDTSTTTSPASMGYRENFPNGARPNGGWRFDFRANTLPSGVSEAVIGFLRGSGVGTTALARVIMNNTGALYLESLTGAGVVDRRVLMQTGISTGQIVRVQLIWRGSGTDQGSLVGYVQAPFSGDLSTLYRKAEIEGIAWSGQTIEAWVCSLSNVTNPTLASTVWSLDFDRVLVTVGGENVTEEYTRDGNLIDQTYTVILPNTPLMDGVHLNGGHRAVEPGEVYTAQIKTRWAGIPDNGASYPYWICAMDIHGQVHDLGCLAKTNGMEGLTGTSNGWQVLTLTLPPIPEDCYVLFWDSRDMIEGEYVCQSPVCSHAVTATLEVTYPLTSSIRTELDTRTPKHYPTLAPLVRDWKRVWARVELGETGTSAYTTFWSGPAKGVQGSLETSDPTLVPQDNFLTSYTSFTTDGIHAPMLQSGSPRVEYTLDVTDTLLMDNEAELPGGVVVGLKKEWKWKERIHYIDLESGRVLRQGVGFSVGDLPGVALQCFTLATKRFLEENWGKRDWIIETPIEKLLVRPKGDIEFTLMEGSWHINPDDGWAYGWWEVEDTPAFEVLEVTVLPWAIPQGATA